METVVTVKDLLEHISNKIMTWVTFNKYKISRNNKTLVYKVDDGFYKIELNTYQGFDLNRDEVSNEIIPYYYRRWDILHDWFKEYTVLTTRDFNSRASIFLEGENLGFQNNFHFLVSNKDFSKDFTLFKEQIIQTENVFYDKFKTLKDLYEYDALPIIENKDYKFNINSVDDLFILLRLVYIISPNDFEELNNRVYTHLSFMGDEIEHPDALNYLPLYDKIIKSLKFI